MKAVRFCSRESNDLGGPAACVALAGSRSDVGCVKPVWRRRTGMTVRIAAQSSLPESGLNRRCVFAKALDTPYPIRDPTALTGRSGHPIPAGVESPRSARSGLSLFEVVISLAVFACSMAAIGHLISTGVRGAIRSRLESQAIMRCESKIAEVVAGITPMQNVGGTFPDDQAWHWSIAVSASSQHASLYLVEVTAAHPSSTTAGNISYTLRRLVRDPQLEMLAYEKALETQATQSSSTSSSSSSSSGASK